MFATFAVIIFSAAFLLAVGTIAWMFALYHEKMVAALTFEPIPAEPPVYHLRINRPRASGVSARKIAPTRGAVLAA
jgi:hypothetical protein